MEGNGSCRACFLRKQPRGGYPLSLATLASSPKGTPLRCAGNLAATTKSRPLGEGGLTRSGKTEGVIPGHACGRQTQKQPDRAVWLLL